jgi:serralysin
LRFFDNGRDIIVEGDVNGDGRADFQIELDGLNTISRADFFL